MRILAKDWWLSKSAKEPTKVSKSRAWVTGPGDRNRFNHRTSWRMQVLPREPELLLGDSYVVLFLVMTCLPVTDENIGPKKELHRSLQVRSFGYEAVDKESWPRGAGGRLRVPGSEKLGARDSKQSLLIPEDRSTQYLRTLAPKAMKSLVFGTRVLKHWVLDPLGIPGPQEFANEPRRPLLHRLLCSTVGTSKNFLIFAIYGGLPKFWSSFGSLV